MLYRWQAVNFYNEAYIDMVSMMVCLIYISLIFMNKVTVFNHLWSTFYNGLAIVATSFFYFFVGIGGLCLANLSFNGGYKPRYRDAVLSMIYSIHNTMNAENPRDIESIEDLNYKPYTIENVIMRAILLMMYYWLIVVVLMGAFLPVFSKEYQYKCIRNGDE